MTHRVVFRHPARAEFIEAADWYEAQRPGLGTDFIAEIERCVGLAADRSGLYSVIYNDIRRATARRFPYSVYFRAEAQRVVVLAVFHGSRDPGIWHRRV